MRYAAQLAVDAGEREVAMEVAERLNALPGVSQTTMIVCLNYIVNCQLDLCRDAAPVDVPKLLSLLRHLLARPAAPFADTDGLAVACLRLARRLPERALRWRVCDAAAELASSPELEKTARVQTCIEALQWTRSADAGEAGVEEAVREACSSVAAAAEKTLARAPELGLSLSETRLLVAHRVEALVRVADRQLLPVVRDILAQADAELCRGVASLLFHHRQCKVAFAAVEEALQWIARKARKEHAVGEMMDAYQRMISIHQERYEDCPGDPNNGALPYADQLQEALETMKDQPIEMRASIQWIVVSLWNTGVKYFTRDLTDGGTKGGVSLAARFCTRAIALCERVDGVRERYGRMMSRFYSTLLQRGATREL